MGIIATIVAKIKSLFRCKPKKEVVFAQPDLNLEIYRKAEYAKEMIENPLYSEIINTLEAELKQMWANTSINDIEKREQAWIMLKMLQNIDLRFKGYINEVLLEKELSRQKSTTSEQESA